MSESKQAELTETVARLIRDILGEEWALDIPIGPKTSFSHDLELESIEFVALAEKLREEFGPSVDFAGWLSKKELHEILGLRVGELVDFILACTAKPPTA